MDERGTDERGLDEGDLEALGLEPGPPKTRWGLHLGLFFATCISTTLIGIFMHVGPPAPDFLLGAEGLEPAGLDWSRWWHGLAYSGTLMGILLCHEMGHFVAARRHGVDVSLPYFIPLPVGLGTLGAVISMREKVRDRNALMDIGAAGPLAGLVVAIPLLILGLLLSDVELVPVGQAAMTEGNSIFYLGLKYLIKGEVLPGGGRDVMLHPVAWAAWCGLLVTMINLIPVGQLDGGHVAFAYFGDRYDQASRWFHRLLPLVGLGVAIYVFTSSLQSVATVEEGDWALWLNTPWQAASAAFSAALPWFIWPLLLLWLRRSSGGRYHHRVGLAALSPGRRRLGMLVLLVFILIFTPIPLRST